MTNYSSTRLEEARPTTAVPGLRYRGRDRIQQSAGRVAEYDYSSPRLEVTEAETN